MTTCVVLNSRLGLIELGLRCAGFELTRSFTSCLYSRYLISERFPSIFHTRRHHFSEYDIDESILAASEVYDEHSQLKYPLEQFFGIVRDFRSADRLPNYVIYEQMIDPTNEPEIDPNLRLANVISGFLGLRYDVEWFTINTEDMGFAFNHQRRFYLARPLFSDPLISESVEGRRLNTLRWFGDIQPNRRFIVVDKCLHGFSIEHIPDSGVSIGGRLYVRDPSSQGLSMSKKSRSATLFPNLYDLEEMNPQWLELMTGVPMCWTEVDGNSRPDLVKKAWRSMRYKIIPNGIGENSYGVFHHWEQQNERLLDIRAASEVCEACSQAEMSTAEEVRFGLSHGCLSISQFGQLPRSGYDIRPRYQDHANKEKPLKTCYDRVRLLRFCSIPQMWMYVGRQVMNALSA